MAVLVLSSPLFFLSSTSYFPLPPLSCDVAVSISWDLLSLFSYHCILDTWIEPLLCNNTSKLVQVVFTQPLKLKAFLSEEEERQRGGDK